MFGGLVVVFLLQSQPAGKNPSLPSQGARSGLLRGKPRRSRRSGGLRRIRLKIHQRYLCNGSGASIGGPNPPPGRLLDWDARVRARNFAHLHRRLGCRFPARFSSNAFPGNFKRKILAGCGVRCDLHAGVGLIRIINQLEAAVLAAAVNCIALGNITTSVPRDTEIWDRDWHCRCKEAGKWTSRPRQSRTQGKDERVADSSSPSGHRSRLQRVTPSVVALAESSMTCAAIRNVELEIVLHHLAWRGGAGSILHSRILV